jgi:hypothetical protein
MEPARISYVEGFERKGWPTTAQAIPGVPPLPERAAEAGAGAEEDEEEGGAGRARRPAANPATWVLDISRPAAEQRLGIDFAAVYAASALAQCAPGAGLSEPRFRSAAPPDHAPALPGRVRRRAQRSWQRACPFLGRAALPSAGLPVPAPTTASAWQPLWRDDASGAAGGDMAFALTQGIAPTAGVRQTRTTALTAPVLRARQARSGRGGAEHGAGAGRGAGRGAGAVRGVGRRAAGRADRARGPHLVAHARLQRHALPHHARHRAHLWVDVLEARARAVRGARRARC